MMKEFRLLREVYSLLLAGDLYILFELLGRVWVEIDVGDCDEIET